MDLATRVQRIEDRLAIENLIARYANAVDDRDLDTVANCFCEDGVYARWNGTDRAVGRTEVRAFYQERLSGTGPSFHYVHAMDVDIVDSTHATGIVTAHAEMGVDGDLLIAALRYVDRYRKGLDDRWRFAERLTRFFYFMPHSELDQSYSSSDRIRFPAPAVTADLPDGLETWKEFGRR
jgi:uncharacterized protein (TIGR02246 family)